MPLIIPDDTLHALRMTEAAARVEIACRLFDAELLGLNDAARFAGLGRGEMREALWQRGLAVHHYTAEAFEQDRRAIEALEAREDADKAKGAVGAGGR